MHVSDLFHPNASLQQKLEYLYGLRTGSKVNWDGRSYRALLSNLGDPQKKLPPVIHVAGTNGKGSVVAMLRAMLEAAGKSVHVYTSPHLLRVNERIVLAGQEIDDEVLESYIDAVLPLIGDEKLSFFEILTAIAFTAFRDVPADVVLLEVGMGGRLDCTNVIEEPLACVINRISMDHSEFLGRSLEHIAYEKAGIMKPGVVCFCGYQGQGEGRKTIEDVFVRSALETGADLRLYGQGWDYELMDDGFVYKETHYPAPALEGAHQIGNAALAVAVLAHLSEALPTNATQRAEGLRHVRWPGRLQRLSDPDERAQLWIDCGHNDSAAEALAVQAQRWQKRDGLSLYLVVGMLKSKDFQGFLRPFLPYVEGVYLTPISGEPFSVTPEQVAGVLGGLLDSVQVHLCEDSRDAIVRICRDHPEEKRILVAGSVYLAGEVIKYDDSR